MTEKNRILSSLNEQVLLLPSLVNRALAANDRVKYRFTLLQAARAHAERPDEVISSLRAERLTAGVQDGSLDRVVGDSERLGKGRYRVPESARIVGDALSDVSDMLEPLRAAGTPESTAFAQRLQAVAVPESGGDELTADAIHAITSGNREVGDSLHLLVMDMHHGTEYCRGRHWKKDTLVYNSNSGGFERWSNQTISTWNRYISAQSRRSPTRRTSRWTTSTGSTSKPSKGLTRTRESRIS